MVSQKNDEIFVYILNNSNFLILNFSLINFFSFFNIDGDISAHHLS